MMPVIGATKEMNTLLFSYKWRSVVNWHVFGLIFPAAEIYMGIILYKSTVLFGIIFIFFGVCLFPVTALGSLLLSAVLILDKSIEVYNYGHLLKKINWAEVTKVKKSRLFNPTTGVFDENFYVFDRNYSWFRRRLVNLGGPIAFTGKIVGLPLLLEQINARAREYHFPIFVLDQQAGGTRSKREVQVEAL